MTRVFIEKSGIRIICGYHFFDFVDAVQNMPLVVFDS